MMFPNPRITKYKSLVNITSLEVASINNNPFSEISSSFLKLTGLVTRLLKTHRGDGNGRVYIISLGIGNIIGEGTTDTDILGENPVEILYCLPLTLDDHPENRSSINPSDQVIKGLLLMLAGRERSQYVRCGAFTVKCKMCDIHGVCKESKGD